MLKKGGYWLWAEVKNGVAGCADWHIKKGLLTEDDIGRQ